MSRINLRRLRQDAHIRALPREVRPAAEQFIQPLFVVEDLASREEVPGLTGVYRDTPDSLLRQIEALLQRREEARAACCPHGRPTALALTLIEQALERDVPVILLDRRGDLSGYANPAWWQRAGDRARAHRGARCR